MNINYKAENKENKQLNLEKRNKQNSGIAKPLMYTGLSIASVAAISIVGKILYDKSKKLVYDHDIQIDNKVLSPAFQKWFRQNMILLQQDFPICWHNASMQFLACPEIISGEEEYKQEFGQEYPQKIKTMINWMKQTIDKQKKDKNLKIEDYFTEKIYISKVPDGIRQNPDGKENKIIGTGKKAGGFIFFKDGSYDDVNGEAVKGLDLCNYGLFNGCNFIDNIVNLDEYDCGCRVITNTADINGIATGYLTVQGIGRKLQFIKNKSKGFTLAYDIGAMDNGVNNFNQISGNMLKQNLNYALCYPSNYGYYPTFIAFKATYPTDHWLGFYITYDTNNQVKYAIRADGCHNGFELLNYSELIDAISKECRCGGKPIGTLCIRYSPLNVVKQYYTPELMFNN